jgi:uncharacterized cupin superfamily protein
MMTITATNVRDIEHYQGPHAIPGIRFRPARTALGVTAWGMNILEFDPGCEGYPRHDHTGDAQEEVYLVLEGSIVMIADGVERTLNRGDMVRVPPEVVRTFVTRADAATLLAIGATPGQAFVPRIPGA